MEIRDNVLKFTCDYQQYGDVNDNYNWEGYIKRDGFVLANNVDIISSLEGVIVDNQSDLEDKRYLIGENGLYNPEGIIRFVVFPASRRPIDYEFKYDEEDGCLYGVWYYVNGDLVNTDYEGFARLYIDEGVNVDEYTVDREIMNSEAFGQHAELALNLMKNQMPNMQSHDEVSDERFEMAKYYFRRLNNTRKLQK